MSQRPARIFLSHASADVALAGFVEEILRAGIPGIEVFRTTRRGQLEAGRGWFGEIEMALRTSSAFMVLITPQSHDRWWVMFEAGAALRSNQPFIPLLVGDLAPPNVNEPLRYLTLVSADDPEAVVQAFEALGGRLKDPRAFGRECKRLAELGRQAGLDAENWKRTEFAGHTYVWGGPVSRLHEELPIQEPAGLAQHLTSIGLQCTRGLLHDPIEGARGFSPIYKVDEWRERRRLLHPENRQILWVKEARRD